VGLSIDFLQEVTTQITKEKNKIVRIGMFFYLTTAMLKSLHQSPLTVRIYAGMKLEFPSSGTVAWLFDKVKY
jgi:hypothetical protein